MTRETSASPRGALEGVPVEMVPTTAREHITGFAALNIPHAWRLSGDCVGELEEVIISEVPSTGCGRPC